MLSTITRGPLTVVGATIAGAPHTIGKYFSLQITFATEQRVSVALHVCDAGGDGGALQLELTCPPATRSHWHAERVRCDHGTPVSAEFLRDFFGALHWAQTHPDATPLSLNDLFAVIREWEPTRR